MLKDPREILAEVAVDRRVVSLGLKPDPNAPTLEDVNLPLDANGLLSPERFCFWLQGFCELQETAPTPLQWERIKGHLSMVFEKAPLTAQELGKALREIEREERRAGSRAVRDQGAGCDMHRRIC